MEQHLVSLIISIVSKNVNLKAVCKRIKKLVGKQETPKPICIRVNHYSDGHTETKRLI
jgi:hypothetical protein